MHARSDSSEVMLPRRDRSTPARTRCSVGSSEANRPPARRWYASDVHLVTGRVVQVGTGDAA